ncbi:MAG TPA: hypothetical protein VGM44_08150 [Polyangiaceae bacterium]|jgi:hypothetical protein
MTQDAHSGFAASRRQILVTTLSTGFALAVTPISASALTTDSNGLEAGEIKIRLAQIAPRSVNAMTSSLE